MCTKVTLLYIILLCCVPAYAVLLKKNCSDCIAYTSCRAAVVATEMSLYHILGSAGCGLDDNGKRMVCCTMVTASAETALEHGIHYHPSLLLLPDNCGVGEEDVYGDRISGGVPVLDLYEYPWMVFISYNTKTGIQFQCTGSLVNERYVLTAAHCIFGHDVHGVKIRMYNVDCQGEHPAACESNTQDVLIEETIPHPGYQRTPQLINDIGLLRLKDPVHFFFDNFGTICLPVTRSMRYRNIVGLSATIAHRENTENNYESARLLYFNVSIHTTQYCLEIYNRVGQKDEMNNKICSDSNSKGTCRGFSGAPLMLWERFGDRKRYIQYGIVSYGPNRCGTDYPEVYTDVTKYLVWILNTLKP